MLLIVISVYLVVTFILTILGIEKQSEGLKIFLISFFLTPLIGVIYLYSAKNKATKIKYYYCKRCDYIYPVKMSNCPICEEEGVNIKLTKYQSPHDITSKIGELSVA
jgi:hypothetical protein